jgi:hypothetical protein
MTQQTDHRRADPRCGDPSQVGTIGCGEPVAVWVEYEQDGATYAATVCHPCATLLRSGVDPMDPHGFYGGRVTVSLWRSIEQQYALAAGARAERGRS